MTNTITVNVKELKAAIKILNDSGLLKEKIKVVGVKTEVMVEEFVDMVETLYKDDATKGKVKKMKSVKDLYNNLVEQLDAVENEVSEEEIKEPKKKIDKKEKKKTVVKKEKKAKVEIGKYGWKADSMCHTIVELAAQNKFTMKDLKKELEGKTKQSIGNILNQLSERGGFISVKDEKTGIITIKKNKENK